MTRMLEIGLAAAVAALGSWGSMASEPPAPAVPPAGSWFERTSPERILATREELDRRSAERIFRRADDFAECLAQEGVSGDASIGDECRCRHAARRLTQRIRDAERGALRNDAGPRAVALGERAAAVETVCDSPARWIPEPSTEWWCLTGLTSRADYQAETYGTEMAARARRRAHEDEAARWLAFRKPERHGSGGPDRLRLLGPTSRSTLMALRRAGVAIPGSNTEPQP